MTTIEELYNERQKMMNVANIRIGADRGQDWNGPKGFWGTSLNCGRDETYRIIVRNGTWAKDLNTAVWYVLKEGEKDAYLGSLIYQIRLVHEKILALENKPIPTNLPTTRTDDAEPFGLFTYNHD